MNTKEVVDYYGINGNLSQFKYRQPSSHSSKVHKV